MVNTPPVVFGRPRVCSCGCAWVGMDPRCWNCHETVLPSVCLPAGPNGAGPRVEAVGKVLVL